MDASYQYLTEVEVSQMTKIAVQTLRNNRFHKRGIPHCKVGRSVRYSRNDVIAYMESRKINTK
jgi:predicted DNA-binding transcriptional regulator AlpA